MELVYPQEKYLLSYSEAYAEEQASDDPETMLKEPEIAIEYAENERKGEGLPEGWVPATTLWLVDGDRFLGRVNIRHRLTPHLMQFGGHIGYMIRPSEQGKGYGKLQLALALEYCRAHLRDAIGGGKVLVTCDDDNIRSARVIEANGGVLENKVENFESGRTVLTRRYWIEL